MPYCDICGAKVREKAKFCHICGEDLSHFDDLSAEGPKEPASSGAPPKPEYTGPTVECQACGDVFPEGQKFCHRCGSSLRQIPVSLVDEGTGKQSRITCKKCKSHIDAENDFCTNCGISLKPDPPKPAPPVPMPVEPAPAAKQVSQPKAKAPAAPKPAHAPKPVSAPKPAETRPAPKPALAVAHSSEPEDDKLAKFKANLEKAYNEGRMPREMYEKNLKKLEERTLGIQ